MLRTLSVVVLVAGCGFTAPDTAPLGQVDAPGATEDGGGGVGTDAPSAACVDGNGDGACDTTAWLCGAMPQSPSSDPFWGNALVEAWWVHDAELAGRGRFVAATPGGSIRLDFRFDWRVDCAGATCPAQLEVGVFGGASPAFVACAIDKTVTRRAAEFGHDASTMVTVPTTSGVYDVRVAIGKQTACGASLSTQPGDNQTIAKICVP